MWFFILLFALAGHSDKPKPKWSDFTHTQIRNRLCFWALALTGLFVLSAGLHGTPANGWHPNAACTAMWHEEDRLADVARTTLAPANDPHSLIRAVGAAHRASKAAGC
jgi:hypothetical protein